jgi:cullin 3
MEKVEQRLNSEESRAYYYLSSSTSAAVRAIVEANLLAPHLQTIISMSESGLDAMIDANRLEDLNRMYRLFSQVSVSSGGPQALRKGLRDSILARGRIINEANDTAIVNQAEKDEEKDTKGKGRAGPQTQTLTAALKWVEDSLDLKDKFDDILKNALLADRLCELSIAEVGKSCDAKTRLSLRRRPLDPSSTSIPELQSTFHYSSTRT